LNPVAVTRKSLNKQKFIEAFSCGMC